MNRPTHRTLREGDGGNDPQQLLDQVLTHHRTHLTSAVTAALDTETGSTALAPLRCELFQGLKPFKLAAPVKRTTSTHTADPATPLPATRLEEVLTRLRDIRLMVERVRARTGLPPDVHTRAHTVATALQRLHAGLQARTLAHDQVHALFRELEEQSAHIGTSMLRLHTQLPRHTVEEWLRATSSLQGIKTTALRLFRNADDNVTTQG
ncbi:hypothetical protein [Streptomyces xylophagus]|uniref:hypothetical protein n=1 Tax=Streptomyces xylophagus TaxID=285514 RepID=UPI0005B932B8|nr:hypothetical protein [Streptomyces xylophagus]